MKLIKIGNLIINAALLIEADFTPGERGVDEETSKPFSRTAKLTLRFSAPQSEPHTDYEGDYTGSDDHAPYERVLRAEDAEAVWQKLCANSNLADF
jgi:hypothetical protein